MAKKPSNDINLRIATFNVRTYRTERNGVKRVRTADLCNAIAALYQLSYNPSFRILSWRNPNHSVKRQLW